MNKAIIVIAALAITATSSCNKPEATIDEESPGSIPKPVTSENVSGTYAVTKVEGNKSGQRSDITEEWFRIYAGACAKDDITMFKPDGSFVVQDGTIECEESTDDTGTWEVLNARQMRIDTDTAVIEEFSSSTLRIVSPVYKTAQGPVIFTYSRK